MIPPVLLPRLRRAILDLLADIGGENNDDTLTRLLVGLGHRVARRDIAVELGWLDVQGLVRSEQLGPFVVAEILPDGLDVAAGQLKVDGVYQHSSRR